MKNTLIFLALLATLLLSLASETDAAKKKGKKEQATEDPYAEIVWPPPPDEAKIKLEEIITTRADVEGESKFKKMLIGASPQSPCPDPLGRRTPVRARIFERPLC